MGVITLHLTDDSPVLVFYPVDHDDMAADAVGFGYTANDAWSAATDVWPIGWAMTVPNAWLDAPASESGPFPLVVFSHGWGNTRFTNSLHTAHLASWGFVVAVPQHLSRDIEANLAGQPTLPPNDVVTVTNSIDLMEAENARTGSTLEGTINLDQIALEGNSAGGRDVVLAASGVEVDTFITVVGTPPVPDDAVAPGELFTTVAGFDLDEYLAGVAPPDKPSLMIVAAEDIAVLPEYSRSVFDWLAPTKRLAVLHNTGHVAFADGCRLYQQGRLAGLVDTFGLEPTSLTVRLSNNGCAPDDARAEDVAAVWNHLATAQLNSVFGRDPQVATASLERDFLDATFPGALDEDTVIE